MNTYKVTFKGPLENRQFFAELRKSVDDYFTNKGIKKTGNHKLFTKTIIITALGPILYGLGLLNGYNVLNGGFAIPLVFTYAAFLILGFFHALAGFNIMHDACHGSFSSNSKVNAWMGNVISFMGSHAFIWKYKHNVVHHTYTNINEIDDDISKWPMMRMSPDQERLKHHKLQAWYMWPLYAISTIYWIYVNDFNKFFTGKIFTSNMPKFPASEKVIFWITKVLYFIAYGILPILALGWFHGLMVLFVLHVSLGIAISVVFQLAHCVEEVDFVPGASEGLTEVGEEWAIHQIATTADFSTKSKVWTWLLGGLNFQVEHHLFPNISHIHYPDIHGIVKAKCEEFGIKFNEYPTFMVALRSHVQHMHQLGQA